MAGGEAAVRVQEAVREGKTEEEGRRKRRRGARTPRWKR